MDSTTAALPDPLTSIRSQKAPLSLLTRESLLCVAIFCICLLAVWPVAEVGINDDWVYTVTAFDFARTGHFIFHGWASPMLGWQAMWGALFAKLFGYTYTAVRLSTIPVAAATILLYHVILRRFGLNAAHATFGTLVFALSPLFLPLSASFMTDVPAILPILLCLYLCQLAVEARTDSKAVLWLTAAALSNIALGTCRQIAWLGVLVMVPSCTWLLRRRRYALHVGAGLWLTGAICIYFMNRWFIHQPFTAPEKLIPGPFHASMFTQVATEAMRFPMTLLLLVLPLLTIALPSIWPLQRRTAAIMAAVLVAVAALLGYFRHLKRAFMIDSPWLGNTFSRFGVMRDGFFRSDRAMPPAGRVLLFFCVVICALAAIQAFRQYRNKSVSSPASRQTISWRQMSILLLPFLTVYCLLLVPRAFFFYLFDRYVLEITAILIIYLLRWHQEHISLRIPAVSIAVLGVFALLVVADMHDLFSLYRAQIRLVHELENAGIPRTEIRGGFAFDFQTQVLQSGYVNDPRIVNPPNAFHRMPKSVVIQRRGIDCTNEIAMYLPSLHTRYMLSAGPSPCVVPSSFPPQTYRTWLPSPSHDVFAGIPLPPETSAPDPDGKK